MTGDAPDLAKKFNLLVENLQKLYGLSFDQILELTSTKILEEKIHIPLEVLKNRELGMLESITLYLKDEKEMKFSEIAKALNRDQRTIWATYNKAKKKVDKQ
ncbi:hypothetical protein GOV05_02630 [Candidatus Woesearchaeota archaeon]|nr:hypothetical protein [Candidatus Woesearchaeota archaeon]